MGRRRPHRSPVRAVVAVVVLALALAAAPAGAPAARAQTAAGVTMTLGSQTTWWLPDQPFSLALDIDAPDAGALEVAVGVHGKLPTRIAFASSAAGRVSGRPLETHAAPVAELPLDEAGRRVFTFTPAARENGVHPVRVELRPRGGGNAVRQFVTHLVHVPATLRGDELAVAALLPVHAPPATRPDGSVAIDDGRAELLAGVAAALAGRPEVDLTLVPTPETVEALAMSPRAQDATTLANLVTAAMGRQVLSAHFVPTNLTTMVAAGLEEESAGQINRGTEVLRTHLAAEPVTATRLIDERLSDDALAHLQADQGVTGVVVPESFLEPITRNTTLTAAFALESRRGPVAAAMADTALTSHFAEDDPVLGAQHLLADLAQLYNDDPSGARRGVVVSPSRTWRPKGAFVDALLRGLGDSPILQPVDIDGFFSAVAPETTGSRRRTATLVRRIAPPPDDVPTAPTLPGNAIRAVRRDLDAFASAVSPESAAGQEVLARLDRTLSVVPSVDLRVPERMRYLSGVREQLQAEIAGVAMPQNRSITLTAREGDIPVTVTSSLGYPMRVVVRLSGAPFEFPEGNEHALVLERENTTSSFAVRAPSSGSFRIQVELLTPEGDLQLTASRFTVRSTAISGVGTALSIGALLFLVVWWGNHLRGRRSKRLVPA